MYATYGCKSVQSGTVSSDLGINFTMLEVLYIRLSLVW